MKRDMSKKILTLRTLFSLGISDGHAYFFYANLLITSQESSTKCIQITSPISFWCFQLIVIRFFILQRCQNGKSKWYSTSHVSYFKVSQHQSLRVPIFHHIFSCAGSKYLYTTFDSSSNLKKNQHIITSSFPTYYSKTSFSHPKSVFPQFWIIIANAFIPKKKKNFWFVRLPPALQTHISHHQ